MPVQPSPCDRFLSRLGKDRRDMTAGKAEVQNQTRLCWTLRLSVQACPLNTDGGAPPQQQ